MVVSIPAAFATNYDKDSQLGVIIFLKGKINGTGIISHVAFSKSEKVCKSSLPAELFALMEEYDAG